MKKDARKLLLSRKSEHRKDRGHGYCGNNPKFRTLQQTSKNTTEASYPDKDGNDREQEEQEAGREQEAKDGNDL